jgi:hypothetical protein
MLLNDLKQLKLFRTLKKGCLNINSTLNAFKCFHKVIFTLTSVKRATKQSLTALIFNLDAVNLS